MIAERPAFFSSPLTCRLLIDTSLPVFSYEIRLLHGLNHRFVGGPKKSSLFLRRMQNSLLFLRVKI
jgi:hypothetical protein